MSIITKTTALIAAVSALGFVGTAHADPGFSARFDYNADAPLSETYARFEKTARSACKVDRVKAGGVAMKAKIEQLCTTQLVTEAVAATEIAALIAYHEAQTGNVLPQRQFAQTN